MSVAQLIDRVQDSEDEPVYCIFFGQFTDLGLTSPGDGVMGKCSVCQMLLAENQESCGKECNAPVSLIFNVKGSLSGKQRAMEAQVAEISTEFATK